MKALSDFIAFITSKRPSTTSVKSSICMKSVTFAGCLSTGRQPEPTVPV